MAKKAKSPGANSTQYLIKQEVAKAHNLLRGNPTRLRTTFSKLRQNTNPRYYPAFISAFFESPFYKLRLLGDLWPKTASQLKRVQPLNSAGLDIEVKWSSEIIKFFDSNAAEFIALKQNVSDEILQGNYPKVLEDLERHEVTKGVSLWSFSIKLLAREKLYGADSNNTIYKSIRQAGGINGYAYFLIFYLGFRSSPGSTVQHIRSQIPEATTAYSSLPVYIRQKLTPFDYTLNSKSVQHIEDIVRHETNSSYDDMHQTLYRALAMLIDTGAENNINLAVECAVTLSHGPLKSQVAAFLHFDRNHAPAIVFCEKNQRLLDAYDIIVEAQLNLTEGRGWNFLQALGWNKKSPTNTDMICDLKRSFEALVTNTGGRELGAIHIEHLCTMLADLDLPCSTFEIARRVWLGVSTLSIFGSARGVILSGFNLPDLAEFMPSTDCALSYLNSLEEIYGKRPSIEMFRNLRGGSTAQTTNYLDLYVEFIKCSRGGGTKDPLLYLNNMPHHLENQLLAVPANKARILAIRGEYEAAAEVIVAAHLRDGESYASLPIEQVIEALLHTSSDFKSTLPYAILLDIGVDHVDNKYTRYRSYAVEDVWEGLGYDSPSSASHSLCSQNREGGIYYLHRICTSDILSDSDRFQSVRELEEERIKVCQSLADIDPSNAGVYLSEIKALTRWLVIYDGLRSIEQSKIYVDVDGLKSHLTASVGPEFDRMMVLRREKAASGEMEDILQSEIIKYRDDDLYGDMKLTFAQENPSKILHYLIVNIWAEYASNSHYGLDVYLSTRIRHGTLKGHLRSPLEENNLICQKGAVAYKDQPHWIERAAELGITQDDWVQDALKSFSQRIDDDIFLLNSEKLRLRSTTSGQGWFNFQPNTTDLMAFEVFLDRNPVDFGEFLNITFDILNRKLELLLLRVQAELQTNYRQNWSGYLRTLRDSAAQAHSAVLRSEFEAAVANAQVAVDLSFERVATWFTLSAARENPDYGIDLAIEIAAKSIENCFGSNVLFVEQKTAEGPHLKGRTLASLVDMFFIVFENIVKHTRQGSVVGEVAQARVDLARTDKIYSISVSNPLPIDTDFALLNERVSGIKQSLSEGGDNRLVTEGGTGFHKLRKILTTDLGLEHEFDFGVGGNNFEVTIMLNAEKVLA
ncbi:hypothetical protein FPV16_22910 [Methylobacterium sp. W2]|uniref:hypothetical protein n=1 Tax=Methylobacterium sp. W2 TaxID=2598107 RepID=UPI001D0C9AAE|nr:hypothetical protein [Methylobacterium sp. W2]MCC0809016.1 hypothetical protein [Methylobacterium sp. W2]